MSFLASATRFSHDSHNLDAKKSGYVHTISDLTVSELEWPRTRAAADIPELPALGPVQLQGSKNQNFSARSATLVTTEYIPTA